MFRCCAARPSETHQQAAMWGSQDAGLFFVFYWTGDFPLFTLCSMVHLLLIWLLSAIALLVVAYVVPGFELDSFGSALIAAVVVGLLNATLGFVLKILTFPLSILTLGLFLLIINAIILLLASAIVPGFKIRGFLAAFLGAVVLMLVRLVFRMLVHV